MLNLSSFDGMAGGQTDGRGPFVSHALVDCPNETLRLR